jgi:hypothetical protein
VLRLRRDVEHELERGVELPGGDDLEVAGVLDD